MFWFNGCLFCDCSIIDCVIAGLEKQSGAISWRKILIFSHRQHRGQRVIGKTMVKMDTHVVWCAINKT